MSSMEHREEAIAVLETKRKQFEQPREIVTITIHDEHGELHYYRLLDLQLRTSAFLKAHLHQHWQNGSKSSRVIHIGTVKIAIFELYFGWLLSGQLDFEAVESTKTVLGYQSKGDLAFDLFALGNMYMDSAFQNYVLDCLTGPYAGYFQHTGLSLDTEQAMQALQMCDHHSGLFRYFVEQEDIYCRTGVIANIIKHVKASENASYDTTVDLCSILVNGLGRKDRSPSDTLVDHCQYHYHAEDATNCFGVTKLKPHPEIPDYLYPTLLASMQHDKIPLGAKVFAADIYSASRAGRRLDMRSIKRHLGRVKWQTICLYVQLFTVAEEAGDHEFQNRLLTALKKEDTNITLDMWFKDFISIAGLLLQAFTSVRTNFSLCRFMVDHIVDQDSLESVVRLARNTDTVPREMLCHLCEWLADYEIKGKEVSRGDWCHRYHLHVDGEANCLGHIVGTPIW